MQRPWLFQKNTWVVRKKQAWHLFFKPSCLWQHPSPFSLRSSSVSFASCLRIPPFLPLREVAEHRPVLVDKWPVADYNTVMITFDALSTAQCFPFICALLHALKDIAPAHHSLVAFLITYASALKKRSARYFTRSIVLLLSFHPTQWGAGCLCVKRICPGENAL